MEAIGLPGADSHRAQHARALDAFENLAPHDTTSRRHVLSLMPRWFLFHLANMDLSLANALHMVRASHAGQPGSPFAIVSACTRRRRGAPLESVTACYGRVRPRR